MCGVTSTNSEWKPIPDSPGEWLWVEQWDCGCVIRCGIAWVPEVDRCPDDMPVLLPCGLRLSWEGTVGVLSQISAWRKIGLPMSLEQQSELSMGIE